MSDRSTSALINLLAAVRTELGRLIAATLDAEQAILEAKRVRRGLDEATEARIREACGVNHTPGVWSNCRCYSIRAAIVADHVARECHDRNHAGLREWLCGWRGKERFDPMTCGPKGWMGQDVALAAYQVKEAVNNERDHADALAEALRIEVEMHSARYGREPDTCARCGFSYPCGFVQHALPLLASHDKRRGK